MSGDAYTGLSGQRDDPIEARAAVCPGRVNDASRPARAASVGPRVPPGTSLAVPAGGGRTCTCDTRCSRCSARGRPTGTSCSSSSTSASAPSGIRTSARSTSYCTSSSGGDWSGVATSVWGRGCAASSGSPREASARCARGSGAVRDGRHRCATRSSSGCWQPSGRGRRRCSLRSSARRPSTGATQPNALFPCDSGPSLPLVTKVVTKRPLGGVHRRSSRGHYSAPRARRAAWGTGSRASRWPFRFRVPWEP